MNDGDYIKLLLDSSFKESERFWTRNNALFIVQALLIGFVLDSISKSYASIRPAIIVVSIVGCVVSIFHILLLRVAEYYNMIWFKSLQNYVSQLASNELDPDLVRWKHFDNHFKIHEKNKPFPKLDSTSIGKGISIVFFVLWLVTFISILNGWIVFK